MSTNNNDNGVDAATNEVGAAHSNSQREFSNRNTARPMATTTTTATSSPTVPTTVITSDLENNHNNNSNSNNSNGIFDGLNEEGSFLSSIYLPSLPSFRWSPTALAFARTTPWLARILLPAVCLATHALFYYGQTAPMWKLRLFADIDTWANATDTTSRSTFDALGLKHNQHLTHHEDRDVQTFTYYYAIHHLWLAKGIPGKLLPRIGAVLLIIFSGAWPHIKLFCLHLTWFFSKQASRRTNTLQWLSTLGKWSLADVLVICVMVGVLNLDWVVDPVAIKQGIISDLPSILDIIKALYTEEALCDKLLKVSCEAARNVATKTKCKACTSAVHTAYVRPSWANSTGAAILSGVDTSGGGIATLRVVGMSGIYAFCGAVILSILLSLMVDIFDHRAKQELKRHHQAEQQLEVPREYDDEMSGRGVGTGNGGLEEPLLGGTATATPLELDFDNGDYQLSSPERRGTFFSTAYAVSAAAITVLVLFAVDWDTMERQVFGAGPQLLHDILGIDWERKYSLTSLMWTTGAHGGWDFMLMATFGLFCVIGPVFRAVLLVTVALLDMCRLPSEPIANMVNFIGAFCSWEVFAVAIVMVQMLMPSITNTIIQNKACKQISEDGSCLQVEFNILPESFWTIVTGGLLLIAFSLVAVNRWTDRGFDTLRTQTQGGRAMFSRVMASNHDYERISTDEQGTIDPLSDDGIEELVFETNHL